MKKVIIPTKLDKEVSRILGDAGFEVVQNPEKAVADLAAENTDAEVIIVRSEKVTPEVMDKLPNLRLVVRAGAGFDNIDTKYARRKNVDVMNTPPTFPPAPANGKNPNSWDVKSPAKPSASSVLDISDAFWRNVSPVSK